MYPLILVNKKHLLQATDIPKDLITLPNNYDKKIIASKQLLNAWLALDQLAKKSNITFYLISGYRSYDYQNDLFNRVVKEKGKDHANNYIAKPGSSEHQTGLALDVDCDLENPLETEFGETNSGIWLKNNAHKCGFIIRYPENKKHITGYNYEPWHIRYVGKQAAKTIYLNNLTLEEYLQIIEKDV